MDPKTILDLVRLFADTWFSLDAYDKETLAPAKVSKKKVKLTAAELQSSIAVLKEELMRKGEATSNFAQERNWEALEGIVGNVMQSFGGNELYPSVQSKAAHLLYFIIKNHPFVVVINVRVLMRLCGFYKKLKCLILIHLHRPPLLHSLF